MTNPSIDDAVSRPIQAGMRDGIPIEKGIEVTEDFLIKNEKLFQDYSRYFMLYPDL